MTANETMNNVNELTNKGVERMTSLGELNLRTFERLAARQVDAMNLLMEHNIRMMKMATEAKGYNELFKGQVETAKELSERLVAESKTNMALAGEVRDEYRVWVEKNLGEVSADLRKAIPTAARSTGESSGPGRERHFQVRPPQHSEMSHPKHL